MKRLAFVLVWAACTDDPGTEFPIEPGTNGSGATSGTEAPEDTSGRFRGRVCVVDDVRALDACATTGAGGLTVTLGDSVAVTFEDGSFTMPTPIGTGLSFTVSGGDVVTTTQLLNARAQINALRQQAFDTMLLETGIVVPPANTGSIIAAVTRGGVPLSGVTATSTPTPAFGPFFDGTAPEPWTLNSTGASGIVWFPGVVTGPAELSFNTLTGGEAIVGGVQVINGGITMVETPLP